MSSHSSFDCLFCSSVRLSICLCVCLSFYLPACLPAFLPACLYACLPAFMPLCLPACLPAYVCLSVCLNVCLSACPSSLSVHLSLSCPSVHLRLSICLSVRLPVDVSLVITKQATTSSSLQTTKEIKWASWYIASSSNLVANLDNMPLTAIVVIVLDLMFLDWRSRHFKNFIQVSFIVYFPIRAQCYKTFYCCNLQTFVAS